MDSVKTGIKKHEKIDPASFRGKFVTVSKSLEGAISRVFWLRKKRTGQLVLPQDNGFTYPWPM